MTVLAPSYSSGGAYSHASATTAAAAAAAVLLASAAVAADADDAPATTLPPTAVKEHRTGLEFPLHLPSPADAPSGVIAPAPARGDAAHLLGCNTRCMLGWCRLAMARAYAFGLYVSDDALEWGAAQARDAADGTAPTLAALLERKRTAPGSMELTLVLRMARDISGEHLAHGFQNSMAARLATRTKTALPAAAAESGAAALAIGRAAATGAPVPAIAPVSAPTFSADGPEPALAQLTRLAAAFNGFKFAVGDNLTFVWARDGTCAAYANGAPVARSVIADPQLIASLFDVYTSADRPVSARAKKTFDTNWASLARATDGAVFALPPPAPAAAAVLVSAAAADEAAPVGKLRAWVNNKRQAARAAMGASDAPSAPPPPPSPLPPAGPTYAVDAAAVARVVAAEHAARTK